MVNCKDCFYCDKIERVAYFDEFDRHEYVWMYRCCEADSWIPEEQAKDGECPTFEALYDEKLDDNETEESSA